MPSALLLETYKTNSSSSVSAESFHLYFDLWVGAFESLSSSSTIGGYVVIFGIMSRQHIVVFSGGSAANNLVDVFGDLAGDRGCSLS